MVKLDMTNEAILEQLAKNEFERIETERMKTYLCTNLDVLQSVAEGYLHSIGEKYDAVMAVGEKNGGEIGTDLKSALEKIMRTSQLMYGIACFKKLHLLSSAKDKYRPTSMYNHWPSEELRSLAHKYIKP